MITSARQPPDRESCPSPAYRAWPARRNGSDPKCRCMG